MSSHLLLEKDVTIYSTSHSQANTKTTNTATFPFRLEVNLKKDLPDRSLIMMSQFFSFRSLGWNETPFVKILLSFFFGWNSSYISFISILSEKVNVEFTIPWKWLLSKEACRCFNSFLYSLTKLTIKWLFLRRYKTSIRVIVWILV